MEFLIITEKNSDEKKKNKNKKTKCGKIVRRIRSLKNNVLKSF